MVSTRVTPNSSQIPVNVIGSSCFARYSKISSELTQNMMLQENGHPKDSELYEKWLTNFPAYKRILNFTPQPIPAPVAYPDQLPPGTGRGFFNSIRGDFALAVVNSIVYRLDSNLGFVQVDTISSAFGDVYMAENLASQICIVDGVNAWIYNYSGTGAVFTKQTLSNGLVPTYVEYHNTFFLFGNGNTTSAGSQWFAYIYDTASTITQFPANSSLALQTKADYALAVKRIPGRGNNVLVFGSTVSEVWTQVSGLQPYVRNPSVNINYGCLSIATIGEGGDYLVWLGANEDEKPVIMVYDGNKGVPISSDGIDYLLSTIKFPGTSTAAMYRAGGHLIYQLTFYDKQDNLTLYYDFDTQRFFNLTDQAGNFHPLRQIIYFQLQTYFVSIRNTALYLLSSDITAIDENIPPVNAQSPYDPNLVYEVPRVRITGNIRQANSTRFRANSLVLTLEQGTDPNFAEINLQPIIGNPVITEIAFNPPSVYVLTESGQVVFTEPAYNVQYNIVAPVESILDPALINGVIYKPRIDLSLSKTGGVTWGQKVGRTLHPLGYIQNILHWESMGVANDLCLKLEFWGTYRWVISNAVMDVIL